MASRIIHYLAHISTGPIRYMALYKNLHASRYRNYIVREVWVEALEYLGSAIRRKRGMIWLVRETKRVSKNSYKAQYSDGLSWLRGEFSSVAKVSFLNRRPGAQNWGIGYSTF